MRITIVGATGLIGRRLTTALTGRGDQVLALSRTGKTVAAARGLAWDATLAPMPAEALDADAVVNLAGTQVAQDRWTKARRRRIRDSWVAATAAIVAGLTAESSPRTLLNASAAGYYGARGDERLDESAPPGQGFIPRLCTEWEATARAAEAHGVRVVLLRSGMVLAREGGALPRLAKATKLMLGGPVGSGRRWISWIHIDDVVGIILRALDDASVRGPLNLTAPEPVRQRDFARALGRALGRPAVTRTPALVLRLVYGEMAGVILGGHRAVPAAAQGLGYRFRHADLDLALQAELTN